MSADKIKIICERYFWYGIPESEVHKANFFSTEPPPTLSVTADLTKFLVQDGFGKIKYEFDTTAQAGDGTNRLFFIASDLRLSFSNCAGDINGYSLARFFMLNADTTFIKFRVKIFYENKLVYMGIIDQDGIEIPIGTNNESDIITCNVIGYEKEFVDYYSKEYLKPNGLLTWGVHYAMPSVPFVTDEDEEELVQPNTITLKNAIIQNMSSVSLKAEDIRLEESIKDYEVVQTPFFYRAGNSNELIWTKTSYERVENENDGRETRWDWLKRLCNGMGWVIFFFYEDGKFCMGIKNRSSVSLPTANLDVRNFSEFKVSKDKAQMTFDHTIIIDGTLIGSDNVFSNNGHLKGEQLIIMSDLTNQNYNTSFISTVFVGSTTYGLTFNSPYIHYYNEEGDNFRYSIITSASDNTPEAITLAKSKILFVDAGDAGTEAQYVNINNRRNGRGFSIGETVTADNKLVFKGCYANMLLKRIGDRWQSYHEYVKTATFKNNFKQFRNSRQNKKFSGTYPGLVLNPFQQFKLLNDPNGLISSIDTYSIQSLTLDLVDETTELELYAAKI